MGVVMVCGANILTACSNDDSDGPDNPGHQGKPLVILDTDLGSSTDDLFSLEILCRYDEQGLCKLLGVVVDREDEDCAACADVMNTYFGHGDVPIGLVRDGIEYKPEQVIADIDWTDAHPIKQVYMKCECDTGQKMWDPMAVFNAVEGDALFTLSDRGYVMLTEAAQTIFHHDATGCCRYQYPRTLDWNAQMLEKIRQINMIH